MTLPIPSFQDLLKTFWLLIQTVLSVFISTFVFYGFIMIAALSDNAWVAGLGFLVCITVFPILFFTYVHYLFWGQREAKRIVVFATAPSWKEGLWQWFIAFTASVIVFTLMFTILFVSFSAAYDFGDRLFARTLLRALMHSSRLNTFLFLLWIFIASEMMAWKRRIAQRQKTKLTATTAPLITIDDELERLKAQMEADKKKNP